MYLYPIYPIRRTEDCRTEAQQIKKEEKACCPGKLWGKLRKIFSHPWITAGGDGEEHPGLQVSRTEYRFPDYLLVKVSVAGISQKEEWGISAVSEENREKIGQILKEQLHELTEDPDHTYVVCREPLSFYYGREFREYLQQEWIEHLLRYGGDGAGHLRWPDVILLGRNPFLPYVLLPCAETLRSVKWYLTEREYRNDEEWLVEELEEEYGLIPELKLFATQEAYGKVRLQTAVPCLVLDFCGSAKVHGMGLMPGSIWLDFAAVEEKERRLASGCPQIRYFSLKKEWKEPRKALEYLDIISKNGYNNPVD